MMTMRARHGSTRVWAVSASLLAATMGVHACKDGPLPPEKDPGLVVRVVTGDTQRFAPGLPLPAPLVVRVTDSAGAARPGVSVMFAPVPGGPVESVTPNFVRTSADGTAQTSAQIRGGVALRLGDPVPAVGAWVAAAPRDTTGRPSVVFRAVPSFSARTLESLGPDTTLVAPANDTTRVWVIGRTFDGLPVLFGAGKRASWTSSDATIARVVYPADAFSDYQWNIISGGPGRATLTATVSRDDGTSVARTYHFTVSDQMRVIQRGLVLRDYAEGGGRLIASYAGVYEWTGTEWAEGLSPIPLAFGATGPAMVTMTPTGVAFAALSADTGDVFKIYRSTSRGVWAPDDPPARASSPPSAAADGSIYVVGTSATGREVYRWDGSSWVSIGFPAAPAGGPVARVAAVSSTEVYLRLSPGEPEKPPFTLAGSDALYRYAAGEWTQIDLPAPRVSAQPYARRLLLAARPGHPVHVLLTDYRALRRLTGSISGKTQEDARLFRLSGTTLLPLDAAVSPLFERWVTITPDGRALAAGRTSSELARETASGWSFPPIIGDWRRHSGMPAWVDATGRTWLTASKLGSAVLRIDAP